MMDPKEILMEFLSCRPEDSMPILQRFAGLERAIAHFDGGKHNFVYVPGTRSDRVVLVAHADTVWDKQYTPSYISLKEEYLLNAMHRPVLRDDVVQQCGWGYWGLGADDRAGCAMLWLLKESGHSLLITDGEEHGQIGSHYLMDHYPELGQELNAHSYMIQLDRSNSHDYKTYSLPVSQEFLNYIEKQTGYFNAGTTSRTDIVALCTQICGVNLSIGYRWEHHPEESLDVKSWLHTFNTVKKKLEKKQPRFPLEEF